MSSNRVSVFSVAGFSFLFALVYAGLFFGLSNFSYWYFSHTFLYAELIHNPGYHMYDWLWNFTATVAMLVCAFVMEFLRGIVRRRKAAP